MLKKIAMAAAGAGALLAGGCTTNAPRAPVQVMRYHLDGPFQGTVLVEPASDAGITPLAAGPFLAAVNDSLVHNGFSPAVPDQQSAYVADVTIDRAPLATYQDPPPVTIGLGVGGFGGGGRRGGVGVGGDASGTFGIGHGKVHEVFGTRLSVLIKRRADGTLVWEGHADTRSSDQPDDFVAKRLADAMFKGFPGESGRSITIR